MTRETQPLRAAGLSQEEWQEYARGWRRRIERARQELAVRERRAWQALPELVQALARFGAQEVYLFGSLLSGDFHERSDIDLAVRGVAPERFYAALARLDDLCDLPIDVVDLDACSPSLRDRILATGRRLL